MLEAKTRLSELVRAAQAGEDVIIANRGEPVARLVPLPRPAGGKRASDPDPQESIVTWLARHPLPGHALGSAEDIDAAIASERDAWD